MTNQYLSKSRHSIELLGTIAVGVLVFVLVGPVVPADEREVPSRESIEAILSGPFAERATVETVVAMGRTAINPLSEIAMDRRAELVLRRSAILMLGLLPWEWSEEALATANELGEPFLRCMALQSAVTSGARNAIPMLIESLDDGDVCIEIIGCPGGNFGVTVADEAVRLLDDLVAGEELVRRRLDSCSHHDVTPWKTWWERQRRAEDTWDGSEDP